MFLRDEQPRTVPFRLKTITTKGDGLAVDGDWNTIRGMIYEKRGG